MTEYSKGLNVMQALFCESVVIVFILMMSQRMKHLSGHLANKIVLFVS